MKLILIFSTFFILSVAKETQFENEIEMRNEKAVSNGEDALRRRETQEEVENKVISNGKGAGQNLDSPPGLKERKSLADNGKRGKESQKSVINSHVNRGINKKGSSSLGGMKTLQSKRGSPIQKVSALMKDGKDLVNKRQFKGAMAVPSTENGKVTIRKRGWRSAWRRMKRFGRRMLRFARKTLKFAVKTGLRLAKFAWKHKRLAMLAVGKKK